MILAHSFQKPGCRLCPQVTSLVVSGHVEFTHIYDPNAVLPKVASFETTQASVSVPIACNPPVEPLSYEKSTTE